MKRIRTTPEEREAMWAEIAARNKRLRDGNVPRVNREWDIEVHDGKHVLVCPWHQVLPAGGAELYFWSMFQELAEGLGEESQREFVESLGELGITVTDPAELVRTFAEWALQSARDRVKEKERARLEDVEEIRQSVGYYEEENDEG